MAILKCTIWMMLLLLPLAAYLLVRLLRRCFGAASLQKGFLRRLSKETLLTGTAIVCFVASVCVQVRGYGWLILLFLVLPFLVFGLLDNTMALRFSWRSFFVDEIGILFAGGLLAANIYYMRNPKLFLGALGDKALALQNSFVLLLIWLICYLLTDIGFVMRGGKKKTLLAVRRKNEALVFGMLAVGAATVLLALLIERMGFGSDTGIIAIAFAYFTQPLHILNIYIGVFLCGTFYYLLGIGFGTILSALFFVFVYAANVIKLTYHSTFFTWLDLLQLKDGITFARELITWKMVVGIVAAVVVVVALIVVFRRQIARVLRPRCRILLAIASAGVLLFFCTLILNDKFQSMDIYQRTWENEQVNVRYNGLLVNMVYNLETVSEIQMDKPDDYSEETSLALMEKFEGLAVETEADDVEPDVILILAESLFDLDGVEGITFSIDIDSTIDQYATTTMISPRYGGYTSAMEFEALTGLTLAYMPNGLTPYTTYFNNPEDVFPNITWEFKKNGYQTTVMHPDLPAFYNRTIVYENFGFDTYLSINDFEVTEDNSTENGWLTDIAFGDYIIAQLDDDDDTPQFVFALTMEGHFVNVDKYAETEVKASSTLLSEELLHQVEQQAQSYYDTDQMIANIIAYMDSTDRPTLLYVFGDHLPPLNALGELGYTSDIYQKYATTFVMYSNYKTLSAGVEYITPNQIAAQIMVDSGIEHSSYYDYIYSLRSTYPVLHKEFVNVEDNEDLADYYYLQYDILMGERYLYEDGE